MTQTKQFRPYFTAAELNLIISLLERTGEAVELSDSVGLKRLLDKLRIFKFKIDSELTKPASIITYKPSTLEKLGGTSPEEQHYLSGCMTPEEEEAYFQKLMGGGDS